MYEGDVHMKVSFDELKNLTWGAVNFAEKEDRISFYRFTEEQQELYRKSGNEGFYKKSFTPAGVRLVFETDSSSLFIRVNFQISTTRSYFSIDVFSNGESVGSLDNFSDTIKEGPYSAQQFEIGEFSKKFDLGKGDKTVTVYLPWSLKTEILDVSVDDGSYVKPVPKPDKKLLVFGDSITQGYDALRPSNHHIIKISDFLGTESFNKAIGGEIFIPALAKTDENFVPDYVLVAYGTNDWSNLTFEAYKKNCKEFFEILSEKYPDAKIFAITPIWRKDYLEERQGWKFFDASSYIEDVADSLDNVYSINGFGFVPHNENMYADLYLHPNDEGFKHYADNLITEIKKYME